MPVFVSIFVNCFIVKPCQGRFSMSNIFVYYLPALTIMFFPKYPSQFDSVPLGIIKLGVSRTMIGLIRNLKRGLMVGVVFLMFFPIASALDGRRYTSAVLREIGAKRIFMRSCLEFKLLIIEVVVKLHYYIIQG